MRHRLSLLRANWTIVAGQAFVFLTLVTLVAFPFLFGVNVVAELVLAVLGIGAGAYVAWLSRRLALDRALLYSVVQSSPVAIILLIPPDGRVTVANPAAQRLFGRPVTPGEVLWSTDSPEGLLDEHGAPLPVPQRPGNRALHGETILRQAVTLVRSDGTSVPLLVNAVPILSEFGFGSGAVVILEDMSHQRDLERLREEFITIIAHDLRAPITTILGYAQLLRRAELSTVATGAPKQALENIVTSARRLNAMVGDLVDFSRIEARQLRLNYQPVQLATLVPAVIERLRPMLGDRPARIEIEGPLPEVYADPNRVEQILTNLLSNAVKYGYPHTEIIIRAWPSDGQVNVSITDQGPGITAEEQKRLFTRFYRAGRPGEQEGLGLGLYITRGLVEAQGGKITVQSTVGVGSTFTFWLPIVQSVAKPAA